MTKTNLIKNTPKMKRIIGIILIVLMAINIGGFLINSIYNRPQIERTPLGWIIIVGVLILGIYLVSQPKKK